MGSLARLVTSCLIGVALLFAGCAEEDSGKNENASSTGAGAPAEPSLDAATAQAAVTQYYAAVDNYNYARAWAFLGSEQRAENKGFRTWRSGYGFNIETNLRGAVPNVVDSNTVTVAVTLNTLDSDACNTDVRQTFEGTWTVDLIGDAPVLSAADVSKIAGPDPVLDVSGCAPAPPTGGTPPPTTAECEPSYPDVCLDPAAYDYDCEGGSGDGPEYVAGPIRVEGSDPFGLDANYDGVGCEPYP